MTSPTIIHALHHSFVAKIKPVGAESVTGGRNNDGNLRTINAQQVVGASSILKRSQNIINNLRWSEKIH